MRPGYVWHLAVSSTNDDLKLCGFDARNHESALFSLCFLKLNAFGAQAEIVRLQAATKAAFKLDNASEAQMLAAAMRTVDDKLKGMATSTLLQHARCNPPRVEDHVSDWTQDKVLPRLLELLKVLPPTAVTTAATHCAVTSPSLVARTVQQSAAERLSHDTRRLWRMLLSVSRRFTRQSRSRTKWLRRQRTLRGGFLKTVFILCRERTALRKL